MIRAGSAVTGFKGVLRDNGAPFWECPHQHEMAAEARECAKAEKKRLDAWWAGQSRTTHNTGREQDG